MLNLSPFLLFDGNCADAMNFYHNCLGGELTLTKVCQTPMKEHMPPAVHDKIVNSRLKNNLIEFTATDWMHPVRKPMKGNMVCMYLNGGSFIEMKQVFDKLSEDADKEFLDELKDMPFGAYGHLVDKYGVHWFFQGERQSKNL